MRLKWVIFFLLVLKPLLIVVISLSLSVAPQLSPMERKAYHKQRVENLLSQHHKLTDITLKYTRLPQEEQDYYDGPLLRVQQLYQQAIHILEMLERATDKQWQGLSEQFHSTTDQIQLDQEKLKRILGRV